MLSDEVRARLAQMAPLQARSPAPPSFPLVAAVAPRPSRVEPAPLPLPDGETLENAAGQHLRFRRPLAAFWPAAEALADHLPFPEDPPDPLPAWHHELAALAAHFPRQALFLDLETCGFAGSPVFLIGLVWQSGGQLWLDQLFARHYAEERAVLESLWKIAERQRVLVTFNGKSFDWPMVRDRTVRHRLAGSGAAGAQREPLTHCDLLHHSRRRWKHVLPDCRLQTLERYLCRRVRHNDLPGSLVPAAYNHFVRSGDTSQICSILEHNALDLVTLVQLAVKLVVSG